MHPRWRRSEPLTLWGFHWKNKGLCSTEVKYAPNLWPSNSTTVYVRTQENKGLCPYVHRKTSQDCQWQLCHNRQKLQTLRRSGKRRLEKQIVVYSYNGFKKGQTTHTTTWMNFTDIMLNKEQGTKVKLLYNAIPMKLKNKVNP